VLRDGERQVETRRIRERQKADDLPDIAEAYRHWRGTGELLPVA
jgi:hypothetical protein